MTSTYLNTDVDIQSSENLTDLATVLEPQCELLDAHRAEDGCWCICLEATESGVISEGHHNPTTDITKLLEVFESLEDEAKRLLNASQVEFNIGWQSSEHRPEGTFAIPGNLLRRISDLGATLAVTIYPSSENDLSDGN